MAAISQIKVELHRRKGRKGPFFMGNIQLPATVDLDNLIVFLYLDDEEKATLLIEPWKDKGENSEIDRDNSAQNRERSRRGRR
jgi:hypothetical protein